jgi:hypothetical protein
MMTPLIIWWSASVRWFALLQAAVTALLLLAPCEASSTLAMEDASMSIDLLIAACRAREEILGEKGFQAEYELRHGQGRNHSRCRVKYITKRGKWRVNFTFLESPDVPIIQGETNFEFASDLNRQMVLHRATGQGVVALPGVIADMGGYLNEWMSLPSEFWLTFKGQPLSEYLALERDAIRIVNLSSGVLAAECLNSGLVFFFSEERGYAVEKVDYHFRQIGASLGRRFTVSSMKRLRPGVWIPSGWEIMNYHGYEKPDSSVADGNPTVWSLKSAECIPIDDAVFKLTFPFGCMVGDNVTGKVWQVGAALGSSRCDTKLWQQARQKKPIAAKSSRKPDAPIGAYAILAANVAAAALMTAIFLFARRQKRAGQNAN